MKLCKRCNKIKHLNEFYPHKLTKSGVAGPCKQCRKEYNQEYKLRNKQFELLPMQRKVSNKKKYKQSKSMLGNFVYSRLSNANWLYQKYHVERRNTVDIAKELGNVASGTVSHWLDKHKIPKRSCHEWLKDSIKKKNAFNKQSRNALGELIFAKVSNKKWMYEQYIEQRKPMKLMTKELCTSYYTIRAWMKKHEIPIRDSHYWMKEPDKIAALAKKISKISRKNYQDENYLKNLRRGRKIKPNKPEKIMINMLNKMFPSEYKYVGDFQVWFGRRNPDFINVNGKKKIIEVFGNYWHQPDEVSPLKKHYQKYGYKTLILWEFDILRNPIKVKNILMEFHNGIQ